MNKSHVDDFINSAKSIFGGRGAIEIWKWHGQPGFLSDQATVPKKVDIFVGELVRQLSPTECANSQSEYIRELKKWFLANPLFMWTRHTKESFSTIAEALDLASNYIDYPTITTTNKTQMQPACTCDSKVLVSCGCQCEYSKWKRKQNP